MDEFQRFGRFRNLRKLVAQPVFDGLHVMVGAALDGLDLFRIGFGELCFELHRVARWRRERAAAIP